VIHPTAIVHPGAKLDGTVQVAPYAVIDKGVEIGPHCIIGPHVYLTGQTTIGAHNRFYAGCVIGEAPQDLKYAGDMEQVTTGGHGFDAADARKRSPLFMNFQPEKRKGSFLNIYAGIHDGYTGSVPITQSMNMFNKLLADMYPSQIKEKISDSLILSLVTKRIDPDYDPNLMLGGRKVYMNRELPDLNFTLFEGTHEMLVPQALSLIKTGLVRNNLQLHILTIGDSNGTFPYSWPQQLKKLLPFSVVVNRSISGNTIGFDNLGHEELNTLRNINHYLDEAYKELEPGQNFDYIIINLGTNDTKRIFNKRQKEVPENMKRLIDMIRQYATEHHKDTPQICIVTPSPMDEQKIDMQKYGGGDSRIQKNNKLFEKLADKIHVNFIDSYPVLKSGFPHKTMDGVHLLESGQFQLANVIASWFGNNQ
jgi:lysophospholipase L1-like esterase